MDLGVIKPQLHTPDNDVESIICHKRTSFRGLHWSIWRCDCKRVGRSWTSSIIVFCCKTPVSSTSLCILCKPRQTSPLDSTTQHHPSDTYSTHFFFLFQILLPYSPEQYDEKLSLKSGSTLGSQRSFRHNIAGLATTSVVIPWSRPQLLASNISNNDGVACIPWPATSKSYAQ